MEARGKMKKGDEEQAVSVSRESSNEKRESTNEKGKKHHLKRKLPPESGDDDDKKEDRRAANRLSAFQSRQRRKMIIEDLQKTVAEQSNHNADQAKKLAELKRLLDAARQETVILRRELGRLDGAASAFPAAPTLGTPGSSAVSQLQLPIHHQQLSLPIHQQHLPQRDPQILHNALLQSAIFLSQMQAQKAKDSNGEASSMDQSTKTFDLRYNRT